MEDVTLQSDSSQEEDSEITQIKQASNQADMDGTMSSDELKTFDSDQNIENHASVLNNELDTLDFVNTDNEKSNFESTPQLRPETDKTFATPLMASSQSRIMGDISLTPTYRSFTPQAANPHNTMIALTPVASGSTQAKNSIKLQNCVSSVSLGCELKLLDIYCRTRFSEYNPARFQGVVMKILDPRATALVFRTGKIVCTGARNEHDSYIAARKFARIIQKLGFPAKFLDFKIQNFIATADLRFPVKLEALQQAHGQFASYEPELFPGLVYRMVGKAETTLARHLTLYTQS
ncbi:unnamed protein product, partial [Iphiclides podalirius]